MRRNEDTNCDVFLTSRQADKVLLAGFLCYLLVSRCALRIPFLKAQPVIRIILGEAALVIPGFVFLRRAEVSVSTQLGMDKSAGGSLGIAVAAMVCCYPVVLVLNILSMHFARNHVAEVLPEVLKLGLLPALAVMALLPALAEEFIFRGILYRSYRRYRPLQGALLSAFLFGLMHMDMNQIPYAVFLGIVLALMAEAAGTVKISMFMHFLFNGGTVLISYFSQGTGGGGPSPEETQAATELLLRESVSLQGILIMAGVSLFALCMLTLVLNKAFKKNGKNMHEILSFKRGTSLPADPWLVFYIWAAIGVTWYFR